MNILFLGEIIGRPGREALAKIIPELKKKYQPDLIIANGENLAHGKGVTKKALSEVISAGVQVVTSGDHIWFQKEGIEILEEKKINLLRPANYPPGVPGRGYLVVNIGSRRVGIINLMGRVFFRESLDCPFRKADEILEELEEKTDIVVVDFHAEATSEKIVLGFYLDGRVSAVIGTHTHVPTADEKILAGDTAYITDVGMIGARDSVIGTKKESALSQFLTQLPFKYELAEDSQVEVNYLFLEINDTNGKTKKIKRVSEVVEI